MFYLAGIFRISSPGDSISSNPGRTVLGKRGEGPGYIEVFQEREGSLNIKRLLLMKGNHISQVKEFCAFLCMGRCKNLDSVKLFLSYAPQLFGTVACVFTSRVSSRLTVGSGNRLMAARCQMKHKLESRFPVKQQ